MSFHRPFFLSRFFIVPALGFFLGSAAMASPGESPGAGWVVVDDFNRPDQYYHGDGWETLNPGYWRIRDHSLRRRLKTRGNRARATGFPFHWESHKNRPMPVEYDPSLPYGMIWRRDWSLYANYSIRIEGRILNLPPHPDKPRWKQEKPGYALLGICFGGETLYESWNGGGKPGDASWYVAWKDDGFFGIFDHRFDTPTPVVKNAVTHASVPSRGDRFEIVLTVKETEPNRSEITALLNVDESTVTVQCSGVDAAKFTEGFFGLVARGLLDFRIDRVLLNPEENRPTPVRLNDLEVCYPLGDTLRRVSDEWRCQFIAIFRNPGKEVEIRVADTPSPPEGWRSVPAAGKAPIITNDLRRNTAVVEVTLPASPAEKTYYYTVWKDGTDVTGDPRNGFLGRKDYIGRLPRLAPPYRLAGLGGHAIHGGAPNLPEAGKFQKNWVHDQPTPDAFKYFEDFNLQILLWEDDVWYLELLFYPPSVDDAYRIITLTLAGPTSRWAMMRHWNVINPGDHDHGMDDVKGPEQYVIRHHSDLGQDPEYMRRNFQIVSHLVAGEERPSGTDNPKRWRRWKMPLRDFSLLIVDARLWRTSQDTRIWDDEGWGHKENLYDRTDPTRTLLGEEQFAWLQEMIRTDSSPLVCVSGLNALHTIWQGWQEDPRTGFRFNQRDRVAADYAGWVKSGAGRVIRLLGERPGVVTVYGDIHLASVIKNVENRLYECSFGPIGRTGSRKPKEGFGPRMRDYDGRELEVLALYTDQYQSPDLQPRKGPSIWNFLEMQFDPRGEDPTFFFKIRNLIDSPDTPPRGGGAVEGRASVTGRPNRCRLPEIRTLPDADILFLTRQGNPIRGTRSLEDGLVPVPGFSRIPPGTWVLMVAQNGTGSETRILETLPLSDD